MENCKLVPTSVAIGTKFSKGDEGFNPTLFKRLVGSLMYLTTTRPDIIQGVSLISRFMEAPKGTHWGARKRILTYSYIVFCYCPCTPHSVILDDFYNEPYMLSLHEENPIFSLFMSRTIPFCKISNKSSVFPSLQDQR